MQKTAKKIILATDKPYSFEYESLLQNLYHRKIELFCAWGLHCQQWELAMDVVITDPIHGEDFHHITTTSHPDEPFEDVIDLANSWFLESEDDTVEIIRL